MIYIYINKHKKIIKIVLKQNKYKNIWICSDITPFPNGMGYLYIWNNTVTKQNYFLCIS